MFKQIRIDMFGNVTCGVLLMFLFVRLMGTVLLWILVVLLAHYLIFLGVCTHYMNWFSFCHNLGKYDLKLYCLICGWNHFSYIILCSYLRLFVEQLEWQFQIHFLSEEMMAFSVFIKTLGLPVFWQSLQVSDKPQDHDGTWSGLT